MQGVSHESGQVSGAAERRGIRKPDRRGGAAWADAVGGESQHQQS